MAKIRIQTALENKDDLSVVKKDFKGILRDNQICYQEEDTKVSITILEDSIFLKRKDFEKCLEFHFKNKNANLKIILFNEKKELCIPMELLFLKIEKEKIHIVYKVEEVKEFIIEYEVLA